jgi:hypothetical protein
MAERSSAAALALQMLFDYTKRGPTSVPRPTLSPREDRGVLS